MNKFDLKKSVRSFRKSQENSTSMN